MSSSTATRDERIRLACLLDACGQQLREEGWFSADELDTITAALRSPVSESETQIDADLKKHAERYGTASAGEFATPRTDAALKLGINGIPQAAYQDLIDLARQLERELAAKAEEAEHHFKNFQAQSFARAELQRASALSSAAEKVEQARRTWACHYFGETRKEPCEKCDCLQGMSWRPEPSAAPAPEAIKFDQWWITQDDNLQPGERFAAWNGWLARSQLAQSATEVTPTEEKK